MAQESTTATEQTATEDEEYDVLPNINMTPTTRISATLTDVAYGDELGSNVEQNDTTAILELEDVEVIQGTLYENDLREDSDVSHTGEAIDDDDPRPTDFRIADGDDAAANVKGDFLFTNEQFGEYTDAETQMLDGPVNLWLNGMSGQRALRELDFNGSPFASYSDNGYLTKGLLQVADGWRDSSSAQKKEMVQNDKAPRVVRPVIPRRDVLGSEIVISLGRLDNSRGYELNIFEAETMADAIGVDGSLDSLRNDWGYVESEYAFSPQFTDFDAADDRIAEEGVSFSMYHGEGWEDKPENATPQTSDFDVSGSVDTATDETDGFTESQLTFIDAIEGAMKGSGETVESFYADDGGLAAVIERNSANFDVTPDVGEVRIELYERLLYLDPADIGE